MRGAGKTTTGKWASRILGWPLLDLDTELERVEGMTIPEMLKDKDWDGFRRRELSLLEYVTILCRSRGGSDAIVLDVRMKIPARAMCRCRMEYLY